MKRSNNCRENSIKENEAEKIKTVNFKRSNREKSIATKVLQKKKNITKVPRILRAPISFSPSNGASLFTLHLFYLSPLNKTPFSLQYHFRRILEHQKSCLQLLE